MTNTHRLGIAAIVLLAAPVLTPSVFAQTEAPLEAATKTISRFSLILYDFDSDEPGKLNERILNEYVYPEIEEKSDIDIVGYSDVVGQEKHNYELALRRAKKIGARITRRFDAGEFKSLTATAVGEEQAPYRYDLPEGRLLSRTVIITLETEGEGAGWIDTDGR